MGEDIVVRLKTTATDGREQFGDNTNFDLMIEAAGIITNLREWIKRLEHESAIDKV